MSLMGTHQLSLDVRGGVKGLPKTGILMLFLLGGCAVGPDFVSPTAPPVNQYTSGKQPVETLAAGGSAQSFKEGAGVAADWWRLFNSPELDAAIKEAIAGNPGLEAAQASLRQSQDNLRAGYGIFYPQIDADFDATRQRFSPEKLGQNSPGNIFNLFTLGATVSYALDIFGGERRTIESLKAQTDFQRYTAAATYLALTGNITNTVIARAAYSAEIDATAQIIGMQREQIEVADAQAQAGIIPYSNILSLRTQLSATEAALPLLKQKLSQSEHLLAILAGHVPAQWSAPPLELADLTLPRDLPVTLPSELVRQRPDILAAEAQLHSASANIGVATAALFPSFTLNGTYGQNGSSISGLFGSQNAFWSVGADLVAPLFEGGTLRFKRKAAIEAYRQTLANYRQTVLGAFAQVADTLRALEHDAELLQAQSQELDTAGEALRLTQINYQAGTVNYLAVLSANNQYFQARIGYLQAIAQRFQDTVALFVVLGGGWQNAQRSDILGDKPPVDGL